MSVGVVVTVLFGAGIVLALLPALWSATRTLRIRRTLTRLLAFRYGRSTLHQPLLVHEHPVEVTPVYRGDGSVHLNLQTRLSGLPSWLTIEPTQALLVTDHMPVRVGVGQVGFSVGLFELMEALSDQSAPLKGVMMRTLQPLTCQCTLSGHVLRLQGMMSTQPEPQLYAQDIAQLVDAHALFWTRVSQQMSPHQWELWTHLFGRTFHMPELQRVALQTMTEQARPELVEPLWAQAWEYTDPGVVMRLAVEHWAAVGKRIPHTLGPARLLSLMSALARATRAGRTAFLQLVYDKLLERTASACTLEDLLEDQPHQAQAIWPVLGALKLAPSQWASPACLERIPTWLQRCPVPDALAMLAHTVDLMVEHVRPEWFDLVAGRFDAQEHRVTLARALVVAVGHGERARGLEWGQRMVEALPHAHLSEIHALCDLLHHAHPRLYAPLLRLSKDASFGASMRGRALAALRPALAALEARAQQAQHAGGLSVSEVSTAAGGLSASELHPGQLSVVPGAGE